MIRFKKAAALAVSAAMLFSAVGCSSSSSGSSSSSSSSASSGLKSSTSTLGSDSSGSDEKGLTYASIKLGEDYKDLKESIKFLHHKTDRASDGTMDKLVAEFNKMYPDIKVEMEAITDYAEDSKLRLTTKDWGDVMFIPSIDKAELSTYFIPFGTTEEMSQYINFANNWELDGQCYGIAYMGNAQGILINSKVFKDAGVTDMPRTPDEFINALKAIKEKTDAIPLYTNYAAGWTMGAWDAYLGAITTGDTTWINQKFVHTKEPFKNNGDGTGAYALYKILYDAVANKLIEEDYSTTDWESCKAKINNGEIGCMVLGSWAVAQMKAAGSHPDDISYIPFPISVNGKQYATAGPDYCYGISKTTSESKQKAAMVFVKWMVENSGWCELEGGYPISKTAFTTFSFTGVEVVENDPALAGEEDFMNNMNSESELAFNAGGDKKIQDIITNAFNDTKSFDDIMAEWTSKWNDAQEELNIKVLY